jgi:hypothetical protein
MNSPRPPALATWLLEHLMIGPNRDAVVGDLVEQFSRRPSAAWYWRQALAAVTLGLWRERYILWMAAVCTMVWTAALAQLPFRWRIWRFTEGAGIFFTAYPWLPWPMSDPNRIAFHSATYALPVLAVLCLYLAITKDFRLRKLTRGMLVGSLALPLGVIPALAFLSAFHSSISVRTLVAEYAVPLPLFVWLVRAIESLPLFVALVLSLWAARTVSERSQSLHTTEGEPA